MPSKPLKQFQQSAENPWQRLAHGGGSGSPPGGRTLAVGGGGKKPPSLTQEFNAAAKQPVQASQSKRSATQVIELKVLMQASALGPAAAQVTVTASKVQVEALKKKLSQPRLTQELTPLGSVTKSYDPGRDRQVMQAIRQMQNQLKQQQGQAKEAFNRSSGIQR